MLRETHGETWTHAWYSATCKAPCFSTSTIWNLQSVDRHAGPLLDPDGLVCWCWGALLILGGNTDANYQTARQNAIVPGVHVDDERCSCPHGFTCRRGQGQSIQSSISNVQASYHDHKTFNCNIFLQSLLTFPLVEPPINRKQIKACFCTQAQFADCIYVCPGVCFSDGTGRNHDLRQHEHLHIFQHHQAVYSRSGCAEKWNICQYHLWFLIYVYKAPGGTGFNWLSSEEHDKALKCKPWIEPWP